MAAGWKGSGQAGCDVATLKWVTRKEHRRNRRRGSSARTSGSMVFTVSLARSAEGLGYVRSAWVHPLGRTKGVHGTARPGVEEGLREGAADEAAESDAERFPFKTRTIPFERSFK